MIWFLTCTVRAGSFTVFLGQAPKPQNPKTPWVLAVIEQFFNFYVFWELLSLILMSPLLLGWRYLWCLCLRVRVLYWSLSLIKSLSKNQTLIYMVFFTNYSNIFVMSSFCLQQQLFYFFLTISLSDLLENCAADEGNLTLG